LHGALDTTVAPRSEWIAVHRSYCCAVAAVHALSQEWTLAVLSPSPAADSDSTTKTLGQKELYTLPVT